MRALAGIVSAQAERGERRQRVAGDARRRRHIFGRVRADLVAVDEQHDAIDEDRAQSSRSRASRASAVMPAGTAPPANDSSRSSSQSGSLAISSTKRAVGGERQRRPASARDRARAARLGDEQHDATSDQRARERPTTWTSFKGSWYPESASPRARRSKLSVEVGAGAATAVGRKLSSEAHGGTSRLTRVVGLAFAAGAMRRRHRAEAGEDRASRSVGCLSEPSRTPGRWSTRPTPCRAPPTPPSPKELAALPKGGKNEFRLIGVSDFNLPAHRDHTVLVKGLPIKATPDQPAQRHLGDHGCANLRTGRQVGPRLR